jgi:hypothetical protein
MQAASPTVTGTTCICQERANARYILQPSGYVALPGDVTFANGRVGALQVDGDVNVRWFGCKGDDSTDDTVEFQSALDYCKDNIKMKMYVPSGRYILSNIDIPSGISIFGDYHGSFGLGNQFGSDYVGTVLKQKSGATGHFICFETLKEDATNDLIGPFHMQGLIVLGNGEVGSTDGIRFQSRDMSEEGVENDLCTRKTRVQAVTLLKDLFVRNFSGNNIWMPNCHVGVSLQNLYSGFAGGYGLFLDVSTGLLDGLAVRDFQGDANLAGS